MFHNNTLVEIFKNLTGHDVRNAALVCKQWAAISFPYRFQMIINVHQELFIKANCYRLIDDADQIVIISDQCEINMTKYFISYHISIEVINIADRALRCKRMAHTDHKCIYAIFKDEIIYNVHRQLLIRSFKL
jgi:hypothetical protein